MRVLIAPDSFGDTLSATAAAASIADGWAAARPGDELILAPFSDGGPGFVDVVAVTGGERRQLDVDGPLDSQVTAHWLLDAGPRVAYVESAQACGLHLLGGPPTPSTALAAHSKGVGQLVDAAVSEGVDQVVVGLGGSSCTDGGRGFLQVFGGLVNARTRLSGVELVAATDVENPLTGPAGAARVFGPQKGADPETVLLLERRNQEWARELHATLGYPVDELPGAGAAGGLGAALLAVGATRVSGADTVAERTSQDGTLATVDLVVTGEGRLDSQSLAGKVVAAVARRARAIEVPTIALAGQVQLDTEALAQAGIVDTGSLVDTAGSVEIAMSDAAAQLRRLAESVAAAYGRSR
ncbi:glycerate kinase [Rhodococcus sp. NPDC058521]|uniref:glycerate kinase family protein n=1 Tax=Rhodococcus sp. NPDC058521 TaxID=3346536 RepID=UPI00365D3DB8